MTIKRYIGVIIILAVAAPIYAQDPKLQNVDEQKLIAILKSNAPLYDKTQACQKLAGIGSEKSVGGFVSTSLFGFRRYDVPLGFSIGQRYDVAVG